MNARPQDLHPNDLNPGTADRTLTALRRLLDLAPYVFPGVRVREDWTAALEQAAAAEKQAKETGR